MLARIVDLQFDRVRQRLHDNHGIALSVSPEATALVVARCTEVESGGRMVDAILTNTVLPQISRELLTASMEGREVRAVALEAARSEEHTSELQSLMRISYAVFCLTQKKERRRIAKQTSPIKDEA